jgi:hypothetical protein
VLGEQLGEPHTQRGNGVGGDIGVVGGGRMGELERSASLKVDRAGDGGEDGRVELEPVGGGATEVACCGFAIP